MIEIKAETYSMNSGGDNLMARIRDSLKLRKVALKADKEVSYEGGKSLSLRFSRDESIFISQRYENGKVEEARAIFFYADNASQKFLEQVRGALRDAGLDRKK